MSEETGWANRDADNTQPRRIQKKRRGKILCAFMRFWNRLRAAGRPSAFRGTIRRKLAWLDVHSFPPLLGEIWSVSVQEMGAEHEDIHIGA